MTTFRPASRSSSLTQPSPSKSNPFARPTAAHSPLSFTRKSILPTVPSPARALDGLSIPGEKGDILNGAVGSVGRGRTGWRLLWRGGLEIGKEGWRLDGVTFLALLSFPGTPTAQIPNPFDAAILPSPGVASPFNSLPAGDTDLCLSLESMRGRKYLQVRGLVDLPEHEQLEGSDDAGVQMSIAPNAPLLAAYFTGMLCRHPKLSSQGRTLSAIAIGLGDDLGSTVLVYGQRSPDTDSPVLKLCVGRIKPPPVAPSEKKVRPGEPLPRAPLFFPAKAPAKPPPPFPRNRTHRSLSRAPSTSSIYAPPPIPPQSPVSTLPSTAGRTPGRRGEKRPRNEQGDQNDERRRKAGRIVRPNLAKARTASTESDLADEERRIGEDEDIFGKRGSSVAPSDRSEREGTELAESSMAARGKRKAPSQLVLDNKAAIRKQVMVLMEERGFPRSHDIFKEVFGMAQRGTYFAFRHRIEVGVLVKSDIQQIVNAHLDMYLPDAAPINILSQVKEEDEEDVLFGESRQEYFPSDTIIPDEPTSGGAFSESAVSETAMSDGLLPEDVLPVGLLAENG